MRTKGYVISEQRVNRVLLKYRELRTEKDIIGKKISNEKDPKMLVNLLEAYNDLFRQVNLLLDTIDMLGLAFDLDKTIYTDIPAEAEVFGVKDVEILKGV